jgi:hypothetical protein
MDSALLSGQRDVTEVQPGGQCVERCYVFGEQAPVRRFFLLFRFYGPEPGVYDGSFELNDIERLD